MIGTVVAVTFCASLLAVGAVVPGWPGAALCFLAATTALATALANLALLRSRR
jgi:hypothetical protein